jgi:hypothetical protein
MNPAALQKLVADAITDNVFLNWRFYVALVSVGILSTVGAALLEGWGKKKGEIAATKSDFEEIKRQLKETTAATKSVELALAHNDWIQRERNALKRAKLEQLIASAFSIARWVAGEARVAIVDEKQDTTVSIDEFEMLSTLYFPELKSQSSKVHHLYREAYALFMDTRIAVAENKFAIETAWKEKRTDDAARLMEERKQHAQNAMPGIVKKSHSVYEAVQELAQSAHAVMEQLTARPAA